jgi:hypothetical protein
MPGDFQPAAASFPSAASGVVLGGVRFSDEHVLQIDIHVLDHTLGYYRLTGH